MHYFRHLLEFWCILCVGIAFAFLITIVLRGRRIPQCFSCGAMKVRRSRPVGIFDSVGGFFRIRPYRCEGCQERFHALRLFEGPSKSRLSVLVAFASPGERNSRRS
jgi:hypothetical protein